jgi:tetratricopeptide (TPR) repeat protein
MIASNAGLIYLLLALFLCNVLSMAEEDTFGYSVDKGISGIDSTLDGIEKGAYEFDVAEEYFDKIIQNCTSLSKEQCTNAYYGKGRVLNDDKEEYEDAMKYFDKAFEMDPSCCQCLVQKAWSLYKLARYKEAFATIDQALEICPSNAHAWSNKGLFYLLGSERDKSQSSGGYEEFKDPGKALEYFNRAIDSKSIFGAALGDAWYNKGLAYEALGQHKEAEEAFAKASEIGMGEQESGLENK